MNDPIGADHRWGDGGTVGHITNHTGEAERSISGHQSMASVIDPEVERFHLVAGSEQLPNHPGGIRTDPPLVQLLPAWCPRTTVKPGDRGSTAVKRPEAAELGKPASRDADLQYPR